MIADFAFRFDQPIVATAIHNGHELTPDFAAAMAIDEETQRREEDPYTDFFTFVCNNRVTGRYSRFMVDLNRPWRRAIYRKPEDAWGLTVRNAPVTRAMQAEARQCYDGFYRRTRFMIDELLRIWPRVFVFDLHSYNHHRQGPDAPFDDPERNPEIILGTSNMPDDWRPLVEQVRQDLVAFDFEGRKLDARIDVKFTGGHFSQWLHSTYHGRVGCIALEFKKTFMDEWTDELDRDKRNLLRKALKSTTPGILRWLSENS